METHMGATPKRIVIGVKVKFEINAKNGLRRVIFGLEKDTQGNDITWKINFQLFEREKKTDPYDDPLVSVDVEVDTTLHSKAEALSQKDKMTAGQAAYVLGPAAQ